MAPQPVPVPVNPPTGSTSGPVNPPTVSTSRPVNPPTGSAPGPYLSDYSTFSKDWKLSTLVWESNPALKTKIWSITPTTLADFIKGRPLGGVQGAGLGIVDARTRPEAGIPPVQVKNSYHIAIDDGRFTTSSLKSSTMEGFRKLDGSLFQELLKKDYVVFYDQLGKVRSAAMASAYLKQAALASVKNPNQKVILLSGGMAGGTPNGLTIFTDKRLLEMFDEGPQLPSDPDGDEQDPLYFGKTASEEKLNNNILDGTATYIMYRPS